MHCHIRRRIHALSIRKSINPTTRFKNEGRKWTEGAKGGAGAREGGAGAREGGAGAREGGAGAREGGAGAREGDERCAVH